MTRLHSLALGHTRVTDKGLVHLKPLGGLRRLWLNNTAVTDAGLKHLDALPQLEMLHLGATKVSKGAREALAKKRPGLRLY